MKVNSRFDQKAKELDEHPVIRDIALKFSQTLKKSVPISKETRLLDFGCGSGLVGMHLHQDSGSIAMVDSSKGMLNILRDKIDRNNISNMTVMNCSIHEISAESEMFDIIYMNNVLHHIEDLPEFFQQISMLLKPSGHVCVGDLTKEDGTFHDDNTDVKHFGFEEHESRRILEECGFTDIRWEQYYLVKKPDKSGCIHDYPLFFMSAIKAQQSSLSLS